MVPELGDDDEPVEGARIVVTGEGNGPVNALDAALRAALTPSRPWLEGVELADFKVRLLAPGGIGEARGTDAVTRVLVESTDRDGSWTTVGVHANVVEASWLALVDAVAYAGLRQGAEDEARAVVATCKQYLLHHGFPGRISTAGNTAFPFTPPELTAGDAYRFSVYHIMNVDALEPLFPVSIEAIGG